MRHQFFEIQTPKKKRVACAVDWIWDKQREIKRDEIQKIHFQFVLKGEFWLFG